MYSRKKNNKGIVIEAMLIACVAITLLYVPKSYAGDPLFHYEYVANMNSARFWGEYLGSDVIVKARINKIELKESLISHVPNGVSNECKVENGTWDCEYTYAYLPNEGMRYSNEFGNYTAYIEYWTKSGKTGIQPIEFGLYDCKTAQLWKHEQASRKRAWIYNNRDYYAMNEEAKMPVVLGNYEYLGSNPAEVVSLENRGIKYWDERQAGWITYNIWRKVDGMCQAGLNNLEKPGSNIIIKQDNNTGKLVAYGMFMETITIGDEITNCSDPFGWGDLGCQLNTPSSPGLHDVTIVTITYKDGEKIKRIHHTTYQYEIVYAPVFVGGIQVVVPVKTLLQ
ncbi:MAG: hypothetical protein D6B28_04700 [Gammaproteobacteria bacterium]|nr:MAG: hypothetical protein D6B28_04700 [Gammaproteobacteria bacterium]